VSEHVNPALRYAPYRLPRFICILMWRSAIWGHVFFTHPGTRSSKKITHIYLRHLILLSPLTERDNDIPAGDGERSGFIFSLSIFSVFPAPSAVKIFKRGVVTFLIPYELSFIHNKGILPGTQLIFPG